MLQFFFEHADCIFQKWNQDLDGSFNLIDLKIDRSSTFIAIWHDR